MLKKKLKSSTKWVPEKGKLEKLFGMVAHDLNDMTNCVHTKIGICKSAMKTSSHLIAQEVMTQQLQCKTHKQERLMLKLQKKIAHRWTRKE